MGNAKKRTSGLYLCVVFFIVLDLGLTRLGYRGIPFFMPFRKIRSRSRQFKVLYLRHKEDGSDFFPSAFSSWHRAFLMSYYGVWCVCVDNLCRMTNCQKNLIEYNKYAGLLLANLRLKGRPRGAFLLCTSSIFIEKVSRSISTAVSAKTFVLVLWFIFLHKSTL